MALDQALALSGLRFFSVNRALDWMGLEAPGSPMGAGLMTLGKTGHGENTRY